MGEIFRELQEESKERETRGAFERWLTEKRGTPLLLEQTQAYEAFKAGMKHYGCMTAVRMFQAEEAALAQPENRPCTCHPDDNPPQPCAQRYALTECKALAQPETDAEPVAWQPPSFSIDSHGALSIPMPAGALHLSPERTRQLGEFLRVTAAIWSGT